MTAQEAQEEIAGIRKAAREVCKSKASIRRFLIRYGIMLPSGRLVKRFRT